MRRLTSVSLLLLCSAPAPAPAADAKQMLLKPARVFDGTSLEPHAGWVVVVRGDRI